MVLLAPAANGPGFEQVTVEPAVVQVNPPEVKLAGAVVFGGRMMVVVTAPVAVLPRLETVTGRLTVAPLISAPEG